MGACHFVFLTRSDYRTLGAFVFSIVGIISVQAGVYGSRGKVVIFAVTLVVVVIVVFALLRWINHLMPFGRFGEAAQRVENITAQALKMQAQPTDAELFDEFFTSTKSGLSYAA